MTTTSIVAVLTHSNLTHCSKCGSSKSKLCYANPIVAEDSIIIKQYFNWSKGMCMRCYNRYISNPKTNKVNNPKRIRFKDKRIALQENPRVGVCNLCRKVVPFDIAKTDMDHFGYNPKSPLSNTLELCVACHRKHHSKTQRYL